MAIKDRIAAIERTFKCRICIHDNTGDIQSFIGTGYRTHLNPYCSLIKKKEDYKLHRCMHCDNAHLQLVLSKNKKPLLKYCHARVGEVVVPIMDDERIIGTVYAGPYRLEPGAFDGEVLELSPYSRLSTQEISLQKDLPKLAPELAENCIQLISLLADNISAAVRSQTGLIHKGAGRKELIMHFIERRHAAPVGLEDLAEHLSLSASRLTQIIRELFDETFPALLTRVRIRHACTMLARSHFTVTQIAQATGFGHQAYFHRVFKKEMGQTPLAYRKSNFKEEAP